MVRAHYLLRFLSTTLYTVGMKTLSYSVVLNVPPAQVWELFTNDKKYRQWARAFSENSHYRGEWQAGRHIIFFDPALGGTTALIEEYKPYQKIRCRHVAIVDKDLTEDRKSKMAHKWIGTIESYTCTQQGDATELLIEIQCHEDFIQMFNEGWAQALKLMEQVV